MTSETPEKVRLTFPTAPLIERQREWVMDYMARNSFGYPKSFDTGTTYDEGADFCEAFSEAFPGRLADPNLKRASRRLAKLLREMWMDNLVTRGRLGNEKYLPQEPSWQYVYSLFPRDLSSRKAALQDHERCECGKLTHVQEACCVHCGRTKDHPPAGRAALQQDPDIAARKGEPCSYPWCGCDFDAICDVAIKDNAHE